jgi:hypothetical protein
MQRGSLSERSGNLRGHGHCKSTTCDASRTAGAEQAFVVGWQPRAAPQ